MLPDISTPPGKHGAASILPPEIWTRIFQSLWREPAPPRSVGRLDSLHQADLAACARVSVTFHQLASPVLYERITTTDLASVLEGANGRPAHPEIESKTALLRRVRHLGLEYARVSTTYTDLVAKSDRHASFASLTLPIQRRKYQYHTTCATRLRSALETLIKADTSGRAIFAGVRSVVLASLSPELTSIEREDDRLERCHADTRTALAQFVALLDPAHFCQSTNDGYLSLPSVARLHRRRSAKGPGPSITIHLRDGLDQPLVLGAPCSWVLERPLECARAEDRDAADEMPGMYAQWLARMGMVRAHHLRCHLNPGQCGLTSNLCGRTKTEEAYVDLTLYASSRHVSHDVPVRLGGRRVRCPLSEKDEGAYVQKMEAEARKALAEYGLGGKKKDSVVCRPVRSAPACLACGHGGDSSS